MISPFLSFYEKLIFSFLFFFSSIPSSFFVTRFLSSSHCKQSGTAFGLRSGITLPCQRESLPRARLGGFLFPFSPRHPSLYPSLACIFSSLSSPPPLPRHSSMLNALPLSTLESERSSLLWRRRGIWD